jgi:hypothetical protein
MTRRMITATCAALLMAAGLTSSAGAQPPILKEFDHYLCYKVTGARIVPPPVILEDQFDQAEKVQQSVKPKRANKLCTPLFEKNHEQVLVDPVIHLMRYPFTPTPKSKTVEVVNQFETVVLKTVNAVELMVPSTKNPEVTPPPPTGEERSYEHYKCYTLAKSTFKKREVVVTDQFGVHTLLLTSRKTLCNPVTKIVAGRVFPIRRPERHLLCYTVKAPIEPERVVFTNNQFGPERLLLKSTTTAGPATELCLPSLKRLIEPAKRSNDAAHQAG